MKPIGNIISCYREKFCTPKQSGIVKSSRGILLFPYKYIQPTCFDGLEEFSHIWIIFGFHHTYNNNNDNNKVWIKSKVQPPKMKSKMGIYACRTPHRHNTIGISVCKI